MEQIKSVIFDWGGVLVDDPRPGLLRYCADAFSLAQEDYIPAHDSFLPEFQKGLISEERFWQSVCRKLGKQGPKARSPWYEAFRSAYAPRADMFAVVSSLRDKGYRTALLSNTELPAVEFLRGLNYDVFDVLVFSCMEGVMKPERRIYEITLERLGSKAQQSIFVDDREDYVQGAIEAGLNAFIFKNVEQVKEELAHLGVRIE